MKKNRTKKHEIHIPDFYAFFTESILATDSRDQKKLVMKVFPSNKTILFTVIRNHSSKTFEEFREAVGEYNK